MGIVTTDLVAEFGALNLNKQTVLFGEILKPSNIERYCTPKAGIQGSYQMARTVVDELTQPFQKTFTAKGNLNFKPNTILMRRAKIDMTLDPDDIYGGWLAFLATEGKTRTEWPITKYYLEEVTKKAKEERGLIAVNGSYVAPTPGTAGGYLTTADGFLKGITTAETATTSNQIVTGVMTSTPYAKVLTFMRTIAPEVFDACGRTVFMSKALVDAIYDNYEALNPNKELKEIGGDEYGYYIKGVQGGKIVGLDGMGSSKRIFCSPKWNMLRLFDQVEEIGNFDVQLEKRQVVLLMDYAVAFGFAFDEFIWHNDQA